MTKLFRTTAIVVAFMTVSLSMAFAQNDADAQNDQEFDASAPTLNYASITVTITDKGANCPDHGEVHSNWRWYNGGTKYLWKDGTTAYYDHVPWTGQVHSISPGGGYTKIVQASVNLWPDGHPEAHNAAILYYPYNPITLNPGTCECYNCEGPDPNNPTPD